MNLYLVLNIIKIANIIPLIPTNIPNTLTNPACKKSIRVIALINMIAPIDSIIEIVIIIINVSKSILCFLSELFIIISFWVFFILRLLHFYSPITFPLKRHGAINKQNILTIKIN